MENMAKTETVYIRVTGDIKEKAESDFVGLAASRLRHSDFVINSIQDGLQIHKFLFSNLYDNVNSYDIYSESNLTGKRENKITCLYDEQTASSAEIFIYVLSKYYSIVIIGDNSYGKSTVITESKIKDYSIIYPKYLTSYNGETIESSGIKNLIATKIKFNL